MEKISRRHFLTHEMPKTVLVLIPPGGAVPVTTESPNSETIVNSAIIGAIGSVGGEALGRSLNYDIERRTLLRAIGFAAGALSSIVIK